MREEGTCDLFDVGQTKAGQCLTLKPEFWSTGLPKHFYVYSQAPWAALLNEPGSFGADVAIVAGARLDAHRLRSVYG